MSVEPQEPREPQTSARLAFSPKCYPGMLWEVGTELLSGVTPPASRGQRRGVAGPVCGGLLVAGAARSPPAATPPVRPDKHGVAAEGHLLPAPPWGLADGARRGHLGELLLSEVTTAVPGGPG